MAGKILFIVLDQLRADCVFGGLAGTVRMPNLRRLMAGGVTFRRHYTVTVPCGPARASLLTGRYAMNHRSVRNGTPLAGHLPNLATEARKRGYEPLLFGYTDASPDPASRAPADPDLTDYEGVLPGFREMAEMRAESNRTWLADLKHKGYDLPHAYWATYLPRDDGGPSAHIRGPAMFDAKDSETAFLATETLKALSVRGGTDWFAHVTFIKPHPPLVAPEPYNRMYDLADLPKPDRPADFDAYRKSHPFIEAFFSATGEHELFIGFDGRMADLPDEDADALRAVYFGLVSEVDAHVGRLLDFLDETGQSDDTLVILTADHGEMLGDKRKWGKRTIHEQAYHIPLIIRDPRNGAAAGGTVEAFTESVDIAPTILDWMGREVPHAFDGRSLLPLVGGVVPDGWRDYVFAEMDYGDPVEPTRFQAFLGSHPTVCNCTLLREERFKLVHFNGGLPPMLFDLENDPLERQNLAGDAAFAGELYRLTAKMLDHRMKHADQSRALMKLTDKGVKTGSRW
ncbi:MAG: alkaline phosphatase family protein [Rhizobiaceae bacterium]